MAEPISRRGATRVLCGTAAALAGGGLAPRAAAEAPHRPALGPAARGAVVTADLVVVHKRRRTMQLFRAGRVFRSYRIRLGFVPVGTKRQHGDGRTPEGYYRIEGRRYDSHYGMALRIDYPRRPDLLRAAAAGVEPGGAIYIHGFPPAFPGFEHMHRLADWTDGCIAVTDREMAELFRLVPDGTPIVIRP
jgi:murein L,D-transpeptidase YafK